MCINVTFEARSFNHCCSGKAIIITYSECVFIALGIQHAMRMRHFMSSVACLAVSYFSVSEKRLAFYKNMTEHYPFKDEAQTALFKAPVRTAL